MFDSISLAVMSAILGAAIALHVGLILVCRIAGVRSFSKLSAFDFAVTVAIGSVLASTLVSDKPPLPNGLVAILALFIVQMSVATLRHRFPAFQNVVDNKPRLVMWEGQVLRRELSAAKVTDDNLRAKLREANVTQLSQVRAVVAESTGDVSVLHSSDPDGAVQAFLMDGVIGYPVKNNECEDFI